MLKGLWALLQGLFLAMGWIKQASDQKTGAALQEGVNLKDEVQRTDNADVAMRDARTVIPERVRGDKANRNRSKK